MPPDIRTEKQKMLANELYLASGPELSAERLHARHLFTRFNATTPEDDLQRIAILKDLLGRFGKRTVVLPTFHCDYGYNIHIGRDTFLNYSCVLLDTAQITIGDEVQIAPGVHLYTATHPIDPAVRRSGLEYGLPITIADGVWLGGRTIVCPGVTIGENTVVGAGSVVTRDLPPNIVAVGNPARIVRRVDEPRRSVTAT